MNECLNLKKSNCKNCYKCIRHCPVKSIRFSDNQANIIYDECILCGQCFVVCPQNAKEIRNDVALVKQLLRGTEPVYASIAPSFVANYDNVSISSMEIALKKLGFAGVEETAIGATIVKSKYEEMIDNAVQDVIISSCCPSVNMLIQKHFPKAIPYLAPVISPMLAHSKDIRRRIPNAKTVFIGPCISKKAEADDNTDVVDYAITFEELSLWIAEEHIFLEPIKDNTDQSRARFFPTAGGILKTMKINPEYTYLSIDGTENCIHAINDILNGKIHKCFIEMSSCIGSCIGGPAMDKRHRDPISDYIVISNYAGKQDLEVAQLSENELMSNLTSLAPTETFISDSAIKEVLLKLGKTKPEDELNCGSCGYDTCREKAIAVITGKANLTMCLPYLKEKAESFSDIIIKNTPNAVIVLNTALEVQQINTAACKLVNIKTPSDIIGDQVVRILDPTIFMDAFQKGKNTYSKQTYLAEYKKYVEQTIIYDKSFNIIICIMRNVTEKENQREAKEEITRKTVEIADNVVEKQMRAVQEIASLLGETAAETKIALTKLKESL